MDSTVPPIIQQMTPSKHNTFTHGSASNVLGNSNNNNNKEANTMNVGSSIDSTHPGVAHSTGGIMYRLSSLLGMSDTTPGEQVWSSGSIEMELLGMRPLYTSLRHIHNRMYPSQTLLPIKNQLSGWFSEVMEPVRGYMNKLIVHVLKLKYAKMKETKERITRHVRSGEERKH